MDLTHVTGDGIITAIVLLVTLFNAYQHSHTMKSILELKVWILQHFVSKADYKKEGE